MNINNKIYEIKPNTESINPLTLTKIFNNTTIPQYIHFHHQNHIILKYSRDTE